MHTKIFFIFFQNLNTWPYNAQRKSVVARVRSFCFFTWENVHCPILTFQFSTFFFSFKTRGTLTQAGDVAYGELGAVCAQSGFCQTKQISIIQAVLTAVNKPRE